jgi:hypothetical protein
MTNVPAGYAQFGDTLAFAERALTTAPGEHPAALRPAGRRVCACDSRADSAWKV